MDTVIGRIGIKVIMTFQFVNVDFMFGLLLDNKTAADASRKIRFLKEKLHLANWNFSDAFPVLLTDNGGEFSDAAAFENGLDEQPETRMFFCDPNFPYQESPSKTTLPCFEKLLKWALPLTITHKKMSILSFLITFTL